MYLLGALLYLVGIVLILRIRYRPPGFGSDRGAILSTLREGWRYVRARRLIVGVLMVTAVANFWGFAYITMVPVIGEQVLGLVRVSDRRRSCRCRVLARWSARW